MALGKRRDKQQELLIPTTQLPRSPGHPFYRALNHYEALRLLAVHLAALRFLRLAIPSCSSSFAPVLGRSAADKPGF